MLVWGDGTVDKHACCISEGTIVQILRAHIKAWQVCSGL